MTHSDATLLCQAHEVLGQLSQQPGAVRHVMKVLPQVERQAVHHYQFHLHRCRDP